MDANAKSYRGSTSAKVLEKAARKKRAKYEKACLEQRRSFMALVYSVDGMAGKGARAYEKRIASLLADTWSREYSSVAGGGPRRGWLLPLCVLTHHYY